MSLYLSRLCLNPLFAPALKLAADPYELHRRLLDTLPCRREKPRTGEQPKTADLLFRVDATDTGPVVLLQTGTEPDWDALELAPRALCCPPQTKPYRPELAEGQRLAFRLLCQPAIRNSGEFGARPNGKTRLGPRRACRSDEQRMEWLRRKAQDFGFTIESVGLSLMKWANSKPLQTEGGSPIESHEEARKRAFSFGPNHRFGAVCFDGILIVTDPDKLGPALCAGIGPGKAFGFGLLSVAPA